MAKILFVDDDPYTLETLTRAVELFGHQPILAGSGKEALQLAAEKSPDLIFVDMLLQDMDGLAVLGTLRTQHATANIPVLVLSAGPEADAADQARQAGARDYINKPIRLQALLDVIQKYTAK